MLRVDKLVIKEYLKFQRLIVLHADKLAAFKTECPGFNKDSSIPVILVNFA